VESESHNLVFSEGESGAETATLTENKMANLIMPESQIVEEEFGEDSEYGSETSPTKPVTMKTGLMT
jgi:hypothetical protein